MKAQNLHQTWHKKLKQLQELQSPFDTLSQITSLLSFTYFCKRKISRIHRSLHERVLLGNDRAAGSRPPLHCAQTQLYFSFCQSGLAHSSALVLLLLPLQVGPTGGRTNQSNYGVMADQIRISDGSTEERRGEEWTGTERKGMGWNPSESHAPPDLVCPDLGSSTTGKHHKNSVAYKRLILDKSVNSLSVTKSLPHSQRSHKIPAAYKKLILNNNNHLSQTPQKNSQCFSFLQ